MKLKSTVEFIVDKKWVVDGFDITNDRALDMLSNDLQSAHIGTELGAQVIKSPDKAVIKKLQGY